MLQFLSMKTAKRLLDEFVPQHYELSLTPDPDELVFSGTVHIRGQLNSPSNSVMLHANSLEITKAAINGNPAKIAHDEKTDELTLSLDRDIDDQSIDVEVEFSGTITEAMVGMYPCNFEHEGAKKRLIATQFESHHAREVFPCVDEPAAKATFDLTLLTPSGDDQVVLGNTPIKTQDDDGEITKTTFETTPKMSTYLLAFVFGEMKSLEAHTREGILVKTWATPDNVEKTAFALDVAVKCLDFYNEYFQTPYPLEKCDMVALPDFAAGAMENWGLITYRESAMLVDEQTTSLPSKQWVALVVAHELAHQWFGNLVTMNWWTDLWLNEGFASWVEYLAIDKLFPEWNMWTQFVTDDFLRGQGLDSLASSHPIEVDVPDPDEIRNIFDAISYSKGASVIRMLDAYLGSEDFRKGLAHYLKTYAYSNAVTADLWEALEETSGKPVREFMHSWTSLTGFPLIRANDSSDGITLSQERYLINANGRDGQESDVWPAPIDGTGTDETITLNDHEVDWRPSPHPLKLNVGQTGFYMVSYDKDWIKRIADELATLDPADRLGVLNDSFQLAKGGYQETTHALTLLEGYTTEDHPAVWDVIASQLGAIRSTMDDDELIESMKPLLRSLSEAQVSRLGWSAGKTESHEDTLLRPTVLATASLGENESIVQDALDTFSMVDTPQDFDPETRSVILGTVAREGSAGDYQTILAWYKKTNDAQLKSSLAGGLSQFRDTNLIDESLELITSEHVRLQEVVHWISFMFSNRKAKAQSWEWLKENWNWLQKQFGTDIMTFMYFPRIAGRSFSSTDFLKQYDEFFASVDSKGISRAIEQGRESIEWQSAWKERDHSSLNDYFA